MRMPFLAIQKSSALLQRREAALRSGGSGRIPFAISPRSLPGAPWQGAHLALKTWAPCRTSSSLNRSGALMAVARVATDRCFAASRINAPKAVCGSIAATL